MHYTVFSSIPGFYCQIVPLPPRSPDIAKCPPGAKSPPVENHFSAKNHLFYLTFVSSNPLLTTPPPWKCSCEGHQWTHLIIWCQFLILTSYQHFIYTQLITSALEPYSFGFQNTLLLFFPPHWLFLTQCLLLVSPLFLNLLMVGCPCTVC